jgi:hypothetical protein
VHYSLYVTFADVPSDLDAAVAAAMAPYDENNSSNEKRGRWDWYQIGGRWTGAFDGYVPESDPKNSETCWICGGTGRRLPPPAAGPGDVPCNGCGSTGTAKKWPTAWKRHPGDVSHAADVARGIEENKIHLPACLLDEEWHEEETWGGKSFIRKPEDEWRAEVIGALRKSGCVVVVDFHS